MFLVVKNILFTLPSIRLAESFGDMVLLRLG